MIGCASHRFALAVNKFIAGEMETVTKANSLMVKLRTLKMSAKLREDTPLRPVLFNTTRWTSISFMIKRYLEIKSVLIYHFSSDPHLLDLLLSPREEAAIEKLNEDMKILNSVTVALQRENLDLSNVRMLFNETLKKYPELDRNNEYIVKDASIVKSKHFENGIIKILEGRENEMKMTEKVQCGRLKKAEDDDSDFGTEENEDDFASAVLRKRRKRCGDSIYMNCQFLQPTSNLTERFFSMAGYSSSDYRQRITPEHLKRAVVSESQRSILEH